MNFLQDFFKYSLSNDKINVALQMLEITQQDFSSIGQTDNRFVDLLRQYPTYSNNLGQFAPIGVNYSKPSDPNLTHLRELYELESIAGKGSEIDQLCNLMHWVHEQAIHTSNVTAPKKVNSLKLLYLIQNEGKHINCSMFATILNEVYLALGWKSRIIHLKPYKNDHIESHVVNAVYCRQLCKWLFFDPNLNAYFKDEMGEILSIIEIRQRLINGKTLQVNDELAFNSDNEVFTAIGQCFSKDFYRLYIAKNIFRYNCPKYSLFDYGSKKHSKEYYELLPLGYRPELLLHPQINTKNGQIMYTTDVMHFWQDF